MTLVKQKCVPLKVNSYQRLMSFVHFYMTLIDRFDTFLLLICSPVDLCLLHFLDFVLLEKEKAFLQDLFFEYMHIALSCAASKTSPLPLSNNQSFSARSLVCRLLPPFPVVSQYLNGIFLLLLSICLIYLGCRFIKSYQAR